MWCYVDGVILEAPSSDEEQGGFREDEENGHTTGGVETRRGHNNPKRDRFFKDRKIVLTLVSARCTRWNRSGQG